MHRLDAASAQMTSHYDSESDYDSASDRLIRRGIMVQQVSRQLELIKSEWAKHTMDAENVDFRALDKGIGMLNAAVSNMTSNATRMARERVSHNLTPEQRRRLRVENMPLYQLAALPSGVASGSGSGLGGGDEDVASIDSLELPVTPCEASSSPVSYVRSLEEVATEQVAIMESLGMPSVLWKEIVDGAEERRICDDMDNPPDIANVEAPTQTKTTTSSTSMDALSK